MKTMSLVVVLCMSLFSGASFSSEAELNRTLIRVINQINAILPLLDEAKGEVEPDSRITLHVDAFIGADGKKHPGVRDDLLAIRDSLIDFINKPAVSPKTVKPLALDFIGR